MHLSSAQDMHVYVKNDLPACRIGVDDDPVSRKVIFSSKITSDHEEPSHYPCLVILKFIECRDMSLRDQEAMERRPWVGILEAENLIVFI